jgi:quercetin dioxygenase-like cupin family protein
MFCYHERVSKKDLGGGVIFQYLGIGQRMSVFHWNMADRSVVPLHHHNEEQFGYVIRGGFEIMLDGEKHGLGAGDAYFIPPDAEHSFVALGDTEAIDVFAPIKKVIPGQDKA